MRLEVFNKAELNIIRRELERKLAAVEGRQYDSADRAFRKNIDRAIYKIDMFLDNDGDYEKDAHLLEQDVEIVNMKADREILEYINRDLIRVRNTIENRGVKSFEDPLFNLMVAVEQIQHLLTTRANRKLQRYGYKKVRSKRSLR